MHITTSDTKNDLFIFIYIVFTCGHGKENRKIRLFNNFNLVITHDFGYNDTETILNLNLCNNIYVCHPQFNHKFIREDVYSKIYDSLKSAVERRILTPSDRPVGHSCSRWS